MDNEYLEHNNSDYLIHYGVLGMKWGVRKNRRGNANNGKRSITRSRLKNDVKFLTSSVSDGRKKLKKRKKANRLNKKQYRKSKKKANEQFGKDVESSYEAYLHNKDLIKKNYKIKYNDIESKYYTDVDKAYDRYDRTLKEARSIYKKNKKQIASGNFYSVKKKK